MLFVRYCSLCAAWVILSISLLFAATSTGIAAERITRLSTSSGVLEIRGVMGTDCGAGSTFADKCEVLYLNDRALLADQHLEITQVFPSKKAPVLISVFTRTEGNACCWESYILDFTKTPPLKLKGFEFGSEIKPTKTGVTFQASAGDNALGDPLVGTYSYELGSGRVVKIDTAPQYETSPLSRETTPDALLRNPALRGPILSVVEKEHFAKYRHAIGVGSPLTKVGDFLVGSGCEPHFCSSRYAMFVLDIPDKLAWAVEGEQSADDTSKPSARMWGVLTPNDVVPLRHIRRWLAEHRIPEGFVKFVPLSTEVSQSFRQPRIAVAPTEESHPLQALAAPPPLPAIHSKVPLEKEGGTFVVPVSINGKLTLNFTIDSGAADVAIPADVVMTLIRTGSLTSDDFMGSETYRLADGSIVPSRVFRIRSLRVGDRMLENVVGSVVPVTGTPLLGQSFLSRFNSWSIDNQSQSLVLE